MYTFKALKHIHHLKQKRNPQLFRSMKQQKASTVFRMLTAKHFSVQFCKSLKYIPRHIFDLGITYFFGMRTLIHYTTAAGKEPPQMLNTTYSSTQTKTTALKKISEIKKYG